VITTTSPLGILDQLSKAPPSVAALAVDQAEQASGTALAEQRHQAEQQLPAMPAPTGLPSRPGPPPRKPSVPAPATPAEPTGGQAAGGPATERTTPETAAPEAPPQPAPRPTFLPGPENTATQDEQAQLAADAQEKFESVGMDTEQVPTSLGLRPTVQMAGKTDPAQLDAARESADGQVVQAKAQAAAGIDADHGLGTIYPAPTNELLSARRRLAGARRPPAGRASQVTPADLAAGLDHSLGPGFRQRLGGERDKYADGERRFEADSAQAHRDSDAEIARLTAQTTREQRTERQKANADVAAHQQEWQAELDKTEQGYAKQATGAAKRQRAEIDAKRAEAEQKAAAKFDEAEADAAKKTHEAEKKAEEEKSRKREESGGFWGWVKSKASALIDGLKAALNAIWDGLRWVVKGLFKLAKAAAMLIIDAVRFVIVGLIKAFGAILKGLVSVALIAFPKIARRINAQIDRAVDFAVGKVNAAADKLKGVVAAVLDFLANTIDKLLGLVQSLYNGLLTVIGMLIRGEFKKLLENFTNVVAAARGAPARFEAAAYEELLGGDFDQPLSPMELVQAEITPPSVTQHASAAESGGQIMDQQAPGPGDAGEQPRKPWSGANVDVEEVITGAELAPEVHAEAEDMLAGSGQGTIAESNAPERSLDAIMTEATAGRPDTGTEQASPTQQTRVPSDGLDPRGRAAARWKIMKQGLANWFEENKVAIIAGTVAALLALAALIFFSGGTILAAIPPIMAALGPLFIGATIATIAGHVEDFVTHAWEGRREAGSKSLAKAAAAGAVELLTYLTFKAGGAVLKGAKAVAKAGFKLVRRGVSAAGKFIAKGLKFLISKGKVLLQGAKGFITKQFRRLRELGEALLARLRFRKIRLLVRGTDFELQGYINPWVTIIKGKIATGIKKVSKGTKGAFELEAEMLKKVAKPGKAGELARKLKAFGSRLLGTREELGRFPQNYRFAGEELPLGKVLAKKYPKGVRFNDKGFPVFPKEYQAGEVVLKRGFSSSRKRDFADAWRELAKDTKKSVKDLKKQFDATHTWHHVEDQKTMQLIPRDLHDGARHSGGVALTKALAGK
jgi:hypothetical protein